MPLESPSVPIYYYECSNGRFRLTYFIPFKKLQSLVSKRKAKAEILIDFPDGLDLDCTEPDFKEFKELYGYRPEHSADSIRDAFLAIFSSTRNWKKFRGTGYIHARDIEGQIDPIESELMSKQLTKEFMPQAPKEASHRKRKSIRRKKRRMGGDREKFLHKFEVKSVDTKKNLKQQKFTRIRMEGGSENSNQLFSRIISKQNLKDG